MKYLKYGYIGSGVFALVGIVLYAIVLGESFTRDVSPDWVSKVKVWGLVFLLLALVTLVCIVVLAIVFDKKNKSKKQVSDEELLSKYKSKK